MGAQVGQGEIAGNGVRMRWVRRARQERGRGLLGRVLKARNIAEGPAAETFLEPRLTHLHDPSRLPGLDTAAERMLRAARDGEQIVIYGDYDVDGVAATAILYHTLRAINPAADVRSYVPHRLEEGYGLNESALVELADGGAKLVVSVDCGITAAGPARAAKQRGLDLIITDHHTPPADPADLPEAFALVHPGLMKGSYPFDALCGAGVAFKLAWRLATLAAGGEKVSAEMRALLLELLGLCSLGVIADVVPLLDENRVIARHGLGRLRYSRFEGVKALIEASGLGGENIREEDVGFRLGPRLNACGRMGHAREAVELLTTAKGARARELAEYLSTQNDRRRETERRIFEQACEMAEQEGMTGPEKRAIVLAHPEWHAGVVGIVCSRLVERFARPTILLHKGESSCHGSGRSIDGFNLHAAVHACRAHLLKYGGHDMAAGMTLERGKVDAFREAFIGNVNEKLRPEDLRRTAVFDTDADAEELDAATVGSLERLAPFGRDNPPVVVRLQGAEIIQGPTPMGTGGKHTSMRIRAGSGVLRVVGWSWSEECAALRRGGTATMLVSPKISRYGGMIRPEAELLDFAIS